MHDKITSLLFPFFVVMELATRCADNFVLPHANKIAFSLWWYFNAQKFVLLMHFIEHGPLDVTCILYKLHISCFV